jgi:hypothetical protein
MLINDPLRSATAPGIDETVASSLPVSGPLSKTESILARACLWLAWSTTREG